MSSTFAQRLHAILAGCRVHEVRDSAAGHVCEIVYEDARGRPKAVALIPAQIENAFAETYAADAEVGEPRAVSRRDLPAEVGAPVGPSYVLQMPLRFGDVKVDMLYREVNWTPIPAFGDAIQVTPHSWHHVERRSYRLDGRLLITLDRWERMDTPEGWTTTPPWEQNNGSRE